MQPRILAASLLLPMILMTSATVVSAAPPAKVDVCHVDETDNVAAGAAACAAGASGSPNAARITADTAR